MTCGSSVLWISALVGHVLSTLIAYGLFAAARMFDHDLYQGLLRAPDYGVSAIAASWLGAVAAAEWRRRGSSFRGKAAIVMSCAAVAMFAWMVQRHVQHHLTFLDSEHGFAFGLGVLIVLDGRATRLAEGLRVLRTAMRAAGSAPNERIHAAGPAKDTMSG